MRLKTIALLLTIALFTLSGPAWAEVVGKLARIEGAVDIMPGGQLPAVAAREGSPVQKGDFVRTKSNSRAEIIFNDGSVVKVAQRSRIDVSEYSGTARKLALPRGKVQATVVPAAGGGARQSFEIRTPNAIAGVRGTSFYVYHQANVTGVAVLEGVVQTTSVANPSKGVTLVAGTATTVTKSKPPTPPRPVTRTEMNSHQSDVTPAAGSAAPSGADSGTAPPTTSTGTGTTSTGTTSTSTESSSTESSSAPATGAAAESTTAPTSTSEPTSTSSTASTGSTGSTSSTGSTPSATTSAPTSATTSAIAETLTAATSTLSAPLQASTAGTPTTTAPTTTTTTTTTTTVVVPPTDATGTLPTPEPPPEPPKPLYTSLLRAGLMSRDAAIDPASNLLTIISDPGISPVLSGTTSLWSGSSAATLAGSYPTLPLTQPNHYWLGSFYSGSTANDTTADGGAYVGYFGGMSIDGSGKTETLLSGLYVDPTGKVGIMQGALPGTVSAGTMNGGGTISLSEMTPISGINPANLAAGWWDQKTGGVVVEATGPAIADMGSTDGKNNGSPSEGFLLSAAFDFTGEMTDRGDVLKLSHFLADPSFGVWTRESFGSYSGAGSKFVLVTNAEWGVMNPDNTFNLNDAIRVVSLGNWQEGALSGKADGVWANLASGSIRLLTGTLTGSANPGTSTFGAVTTGSFIDLSRFLANPSLAASLGFPTVSSASFSLTGKNSGGSVNLGTLTFYGRSTADPVQLWVAPNITGSFSGSLGGQRYGLMNGADIAASTVMGEMYIGSVSATGTTWLGFMNAVGETGSSFRSDFDGVAAGSVSGTTFTGAAAGLSHPVTYFSRFDGSAAQLTRFAAGSVLSYGRLDGFMAGMSLWGSAMDAPSDFKAVGFFTPNQALTSGDYVMSAPIISKDYPTGLAQTADGGAYNGHVVAGVNLYGGGFAPGISGVVNTLYVDPAGNAGILTGDLYGFLDGMTNLWMADGELFTVPLSSGGVTAANLNSAAGVTTITTSYGTGTSFTGVPGLGAWAPGTLTRSFISSYPDWGIAQFGLYAPYSAPPLDGSTWHLDFAISDGTIPSTVLMGNMAGSPWDSTSGVLQARTRGGFFDMKSGQAAATPSTGIFFGETVGTFNPTSLQAMTSGVWMETGRFLALASTAAGRGTLEKLNIPAAEVGKADFSGGNTDYSVQVKDVRFFAPLSGGRPQLFATDNISGNYFVTTPTGTVTLSQVTSGTGYGVSGISPTFSIKQWDASTGKWNASFNFNGSTGMVGGANNVQLSGAAGGRISTTGTFSGTAAGMVR